MNYDLFNTPLSLSCLQFLSHARTCTHPSPHKSKLIVQGLYTLNLRFLILGYFLKISTWKWDHCTGQHWDFLCVAPFLLKHYTSSWSEDGMYERGRVSSSMPTWKMVIRMKLPWASFSNRPCSLSPTSALTEHIQTPQDAQDGHKSQHRGKWQAEGS